MCCVGSRGTTPTTNVSQNHWLTWQRYYHNRPFWVSLNFLSKSDWMISFSDFDCTANAPKRDRSPIGFSIITVADLIRLSHTPCKGLTTHSGGHHGNWPKRDKYPGPTYKATHTNSIQNLRAIPFRSSAFSTEKMLLSERDFLLVIIKTIIQVDHDCRVAF